MAGRKPLPTKLKMLKGTAQKCRVNPNEPELAPALPEPPAFLGETAREEWLRKAPVLARMGVLTEGDDAALAAYCQAFERFVEAERKIRQSGLLIKTTGGNVIQNPLVGVANRAIEIMHKFLTEFGLTPASRAKVKVATPTLRGSAPSVLTASRKAGVNVVSGALGPWLVR